MGAGNRFFLPNQFSVGADGPRAGAKLTFWVTGTNTPQNTYSNAGLTVANTNPVIADSLGQFGNVFLLGSPSYRVKLSDSDDVEIWTMDPVGPSVAITGAIPVGGLTPYAGATAPAGFLLCYGQAISRTTYSELFAAVGIAWGAGDASTTFNVPDFRGRTPIGRDDMGGAAANRVTSGVSGINGILIGATGGDQRAMLHTHTVTDPGHVHSKTDPGHVHGEQIPIVTAGSAPIQQPLVGRVGGPGTWGVDTLSATTGITISSAVTGITIVNALAGTAQNMPPAGVVNYLIFANA